MRAPWIRNGLRKALDWCAPQRLGVRSRRAGTSLVVAVCLVVLSLAIAAPPVRSLDAARINSTAGVQFESAVNWAMCGRYGQSASASPQTRRVISLADTGAPQVYDGSVVDLIERRVGSRYLYCLQPASSAVV